MVIRPLSAILDDLAACDDPLIAGWAAAMLKHGESERTQRAMRRVRKRPQKG